MKQLSTSMKNRTMSGRLVGDLASGIFAMDILKTAFMLILIMRLSQMFLPDR
ncbi:hypothetical protein H206_05645 [Candidatus Electrothrix aarhusensis]|uniref:Uncharacterized protein n=1 Tax=Candidatus Electrothrix aarhusensis TaxID=1859131 RepID=A0A3S3UDN7_9BACT|nr:hypothetical protein H206_05645 [Candidatus Electrothrix aarhusensis]